MVERQKETRNYGRVGEKEMTICMGEGESCIYHISQGGMCDPCSTCENPPSCDFAYDEYLQQNSGKVSSDGK